MGGLPERSEEFHFLDNLKRSVVVAAGVAGFAGGSHLPEHPSHSLALSVLLGTGLGRVVSFVACFSHLNRSGSVLLGNADSLVPPAQLSGIGTGLGRVVSMVACFSQLNSSGSVLLDGLEPSKLQLGSGTGLGKAGGLPEVVAHMGSLESHTEPLLLLHGSGVGLGQAVVSIVGMFSKVDSNGCVLFESLHPAEPLLGSGTGLNQ